MEHTEDILGLDSITSSLVVPEPFNALSLSNTPGKECRRWLHGNTSIFLTRLLCRKNISHSRVSVAGHVWLSKLSSDVIFSPQMSQCQVWSTVNDTCWKSTLLFLRCRKWIQLIWHQWYFLGKSWNVCVLALFRLITENFFPSCHN